MCVKLFVSDVFLYDLEFRLSSVGVNCRQTCGLCVQPRRDGLPKFRIRKLQGSVGIMSRWRRCKLIIQEISCNESR